MLSNKSYYVYFFKYFFIISVLYDLKLSAIIIEIFHLARKEIGIYTLSCYTGVAKHSGTLKNGFPKFYILFELKDSVR